MDTAFHCKNLAAITTITKKGEKHPLKELGSFSFEKGQHKKDAFLNQAKTYQSWSLECNLFDFFYPAFIIL